MTTYQEREITKAYCYFAGTTKIANDTLTDFSLAYPALSNISLTTLRNIVANNIEEVKDIVDPYVDNAQVFGSIRLTQPLLTFYKEATSNPLRVSEFASLLDTHPVLKVQDQRILRNALQTIYAEDTPDASKEGPAAGPIEAPKDEASAPEYTAATPDTNPREAKLRTEILEALTDHMTKDVFNSRIIPQIEITAIKAVKNSFVANLKFISQDGTVSVYSDAIAMGKKLLPPVEIYDEAGHKVGEFDKASFEKVFAFDASTTSSGENHQAMMDELLETATPVQASQIIKAMTTKFGADVAKKAFDSYVALRIGGKGKGKEKVPAATNAAKPATSIAFPDDLAEDTLYDTTPVNKFTDKQKKGDNK